jgi:hypothetical protein
MLRGLFVVKQPTVLDGLTFDPFSFQQDGLTAPEVDVGRGEIVDALVIAPVVVVRDECIDLSFEIAGHRLDKAGSKVGQKTRTFVLALLVRSTVDLFADHLFARFSFEIACRASSALSAVSV